MGLDMMAEQHRSVTQRESHALRAMLRHFHTCAQEQKQRRRRSRRPWRLFWTRRCWGRRWSCCACCARYAAAAVMSLPLGRRFPWNACSCWSLPVREHRLRFKALLSVTMASWCAFLSIFTRFTQVHMGV